MSKFRNPVISHDAFAASETEAVDMNVAFDSDTRVDTAPCPARVTEGRASPRTGQLQVRDNAQRTRFILVWSHIDGTVVLATSRTFRTIRDAMTEGIARFGVLPMRWR